MPNDLTVEALCTEARRFAEIESAHAEPSLYGVTDGKAVGTYLEALSLIFPQYSEHFSLNRHRSPIHEYRLHGCIRGLQTDPIARFQVEALERCFCPSTSATTMSPSRASLACSTST